MSTNLEGNSTSPGLPSPFPPCFQNGDCKVDTMSVGNVIERAIL